MTMRDAVWLSVVVSAYAVGWLDGTVGAAGLIDRELSRLGFEIVASGVR